MFITSDKTKEKETDLTETTSTNVCWTGGMSDGEMTQVLSAFKILLLVLPLYVLPSRKTKHVPVTVLYH